MRKVTIDANVNADSGWVEIDPSRVRIAADDTVTWVFTGLPDDRRPALLFESFIPEAGVAIGTVDPFRNLFRQLSRQDENNAIHGSGFDGLAGEYMYTICLVGKEADDLLVRKLQCRRVPAAGLVPDPGTRGNKSNA